MPERMPRFEETHAVESQEIIELREEFAQELKKPCEGSYLKKLRRVAGAFALAGVTVFAPQKSTAPELSPEFLVAGRVESLHQLYQTEKIDLYKKVLKSLKEKGGVPASHDAPGKTMKVLPRDVLSISQTLAREGQIPHFSRPEVILGEDFMKEQPEKTKEYMEKIEKTMRATVLIMRTEEGGGSGTIVKTGAGKIILTNAHVVRKGTNVFVELMDGNHAAARVMYTDKKKDLAVLSFPKEFEKIASGKYRPEALGIHGETDDILKHKEKLVAVGHPLRFPWEVVTMEYLQKDEEKWEGYNYKSIVSKSDARFEKIASFSHPEYKQRFPKGQVLGGMSGGPVISLERAGEPKLFGLISYMQANATGRKSLAEHVKNENVQSVSGAVSAEEIREFMQKYENLKPSDLEY